MGWQTHAGSGFEQKKWYFAVVPNHGINIKNGLYKIRNSPRKKGIRWLF
jgi:hypothetical protein